MQYHRLGALRKTIASHSSRGYKYKKSVTAELDSGEVSLFVLPMAAFLWCPQMTFPLCTTDVFLFL